MKLTFIEGHTKLRKEYSTDGVQAYPLVKRVTSFSSFIPHTIEGLRDKTNLLIKHASFGHAMLKGPLSKELNNESRAGFTDRNALAENIVLDLDGIIVNGLEITAPINKDQIATVAERCIELLPTEFHNTSYIVHASSSMGLKGNKISLHLDFLLNEPVLPSTLKCWITGINIETPFFKNQLELSATGAALKFKLDPTMADNTRIIYIAPPKFKGITNPIPDETDRIFLIEKENIGLTVPDKYSKLKHETQQAVLRDIIAAMRDAAGMPRKLTTHIMYNSGGEQHRVVANPDKIAMTLAYETDQWIYYNLNGGDSNAYYVWRHKPQVVWNFKGEQPFFFEQACPEAYADHIERYIKNDAEAMRQFEPEPIVFSDPTTDTIYRALINRASNTIDQIYKTHRAGAKDWMLEFNKPEPEHIPIYNYVFDPRDERTLDLQQRFINQYKKSDLMASPPDIDDRYKYLTYERVMDLEPLCPNIFKLLRSVTGNSDKELVHFVNWFAFIVCRREKTQTAWVLHGTEGTGKGVLFERVIRRILGHDSAIQVRAENLNEQYNAYMEKALLIMVDEFKFNTAKGAQALLEKLRNYITEPTITIRGMRENVRTVNNYSNVVLCGNERDMMRPSEEDRRYNVAPRQEIKLIVRYPELKNNLELIDREVPAFASAMLHFHYSEAMAKTALDNSAKAIMRNAARSTIDDFMKALRDGNLEFFLDILDMDDMMSNNNSEYVGAAKNVVRRVIDTYNPILGVPLLTCHMQYLYMAFTNDIRMSERAFGKMLARQGIDVGERFTIGTYRGRGTRIHFTHPNIEQVRETYMIPTASNVTPISAGKQ